MTAQLIQPLVIAALDVTEVAVWQLRVALATRGRKRSAATLGAVNAVLSVEADEWLTREQLQYRVLVGDDGELVAGRLRLEGWLNGRRPRAPAPAP